MIKISKLADYAIAIMHTLMATNTCLSVAKIALKTRISAPTASKILKKLTEARLLASVSGPKGGYQLNQAAETITLAQLVSAIDGRPAMTTCCEKEYDCARDRICGQQNNWRKINAMVFSVLENVLLKDMMSHDVLNKRETIP